MALKVERRLVKWGHGYGIRLSRDEVERKLRTKAGRKVRATLEPDVSERNDLDGLVVMRSRHPYNVQRIVEEEVGR